MKRNNEEFNLLEAADRVFPGGSLGNIRLEEGYDFVVDSGSGSHIRDISGNHYIDYLLGSGPMVLGHAHPLVVDAVTEVVKKGSTFFTQNRYAIQLAEEIIKAMPCAEQVRYVSSGTEATYNALKVARAYTGRDKILKFEGGFHGMHDYSQMSLSPSGNLPFPDPEPSSAGIPKVIAETVLVAPYNDLIYVAELLERHHNEIAAVIVEPVQRIIEPQPDFLAGLRELTRKYDVLLVFDEIVTGFRLAYGGAQAYYNVVPDLAAIGKIVGGGYPLAAVVGKEEIMATYDQKSVNPSQYIPHIGTLNGNPVACVAGLTTLEILRNECSYENYHSKSNYLKSTLQGLFDEAEVPATVTGINMMFDVLFTSNPIIDYRSTLTNKTLNKIFDRTLLENGIFKSPGKFYVGFCHSDEDIQQTIEAFKLGVAEVQKAN